VAGRKSGISFGYPDQTKLGLSLGFWNHSSLTYSSWTQHITDLSGTWSSIFFGDTSLCQPNTHLIRGNMVLDTFTKLIENITTLFISQSKCYLVLLVVQVAESREYWHWVRNNFAIFGVSELNGSNLLFSSPKLVYSGKPIPCWFSPNSFAVTAWGSKCHLKGAT